MAGWLNKTVIVCVALAFPGLAPARDCGVLGNLFPVTEPSILETISARLSDMEGSGELDEIRQEMQNTTRAYVNRPKPVAGLKKARVYDRFEVDLSITLERDLADQHGRIFAYRGTVVNPLDFSRYSKRIIIFDGDDPAQVAFALSDGNELDTLLVITNGAPLELMRQHGRRFYFDQDAVMTSKFQLRRLPSVITRADPFMLVEEMPVGQSAP